MTLLVKTGRGFNSVYTVDEDLRVRFGEKRRVKGRIGPFQEVETIGDNRARLQVTIHEKNSRSGMGFKGGRHYLDATIASMRNRIRHLRDVEAEQVADFDERIEEAVAALLALRREREEYVRTVAWARAHKSTQRELVDRAEQDAEDRRLRQGVYAPRDEA